MEYVVSAKRRLSKQKEEVCLVEKILLTDEGINQAIADVSDYDFVVDPTGIGRGIAKAQIRKIADELEGVFPKLSRYGARDYLADYIRALHKELE